MRSETRALSRALRALLWVGAVFFSFDCGSTREEPTGGETHFLSTCDSDAACGGDLSCVCHVCTVTCAAAASCARFAGASCVASAAACGTAKICDVSCAEPADCAGVPGATACVAGVCREPDRSVDECPASGIKANEVAILGDAFFATSHRITGFLEEAARQSGVLSAGERYRDYSNLTANTLALGGNGIASQYDSAVAESSVKVVIMTGGGADVLLGSCDTLSPECPLLVDAANAAADLLQRLAKDGVQHVVYVFYPDPADAKLRAEVDTLRPLLERVCQDSPVPCHWLDLRPPFAGNEATYLEPPGTSPTVDGARVGAQAIWSVMQQECIAQ